MGTYYEFEGSFVAKKGVKMDDILAHPDVKDLFDGEELVTRKLHSGALQVGVRVARQMSYSSAELIDDTFTELAMKFADFSRGPASCKSGGEDYPEGPDAWFIAPRRSATRAMIARELAVIAEAKKKIAKLRAALKAGRKTDIIKTN